MVSWKLLLQDSQLSTSATEDSLKSGDITYVTLYM